METGTWPVEKSSDDVAQPNSEQWWGKKYRTIDKQENNTFRITFHQKVIILDDLSTDISSVKTKK